jgi:hypothetical protein
MTTARVMGGGPRWFGAQGPVGVEGIAIPAAGGGPAGQELASSLRPLGRLT